MIKRAVATLSVLMACAAVPAGAAAAEPWRDPGQPPPARADELLGALTSTRRSTSPWATSPPCRGLGVARAHCQPTGRTASVMTARPAALRAVARCDVRPPARARLREGDRRRAAREGLQQLARAGDGHRADAARGRQPENLGEDPFLAGHTAAAEVAWRRSPGHAIATLKHYVANNQEYQRIGFTILPAGRLRPGVMRSSPSARCRRSTRRRSDRRPRGGADGVMCSYNRVNGTPTCESRELLADLKHAGASTASSSPISRFAVRDGLAAANAGVDVPALRAT